VEAQLRLLREYEALAQGGKGLFLRQHGLYTAQISAWRKIRDEKFLKDAPKRGRKAKEVNPLSKELALKERLKRCSTASSSWTCQPRRRSRGCWTRASIWAQKAPFIAS